MAPSPSYLPASCRDIMCWQLATVATSATLPRYARRRGRTPLATACAALFVRGICRYYPLPTANCQLPTINYSLSTTFLHFYTAISTARAPSPLLRPLARLTSFGGICRYYTAIFSVTAGGTRSRASAFSLMRSLVRRPCGPVPGHQASSRCLRRAIEAASARFVAPSLAKMALTCSLTV